MLTMSRDCDGITSLFLFSGQILIFSVNECLSEDMLKVPENEYVDIEELRYSLEDLRYNS